jgi:hypothetical protein
MWIIPRLFPTGNLSNEEPATNKKPHRETVGLSYRKSYTLNDDPHPQVLFTFGFSNLNPAPSSVST